ncbi:MAG: hypothetical protein N2512_13780 [Armatimonadetes bacterium]|nr:hypothetical protein [Armatimonadota bacterium]
MANDDFDRELEEAAAQARAAAPPSLAEKEKVPGRAAMSAKKPGAVGRAAEKLTEAVSTLRTPRVGFRELGYGLGVLVILALLIQNWAPVRINVFGLYADVPKAVAFLVTLAAGMGLLKLWQGRGSRKADAEEGQE